jgi:hypothetical protein
MRRDCLAFCSTINTVTPVCTICLTASKMLLIISGANPKDGSSNNKSFGFIMSARPIASICCSPPERVVACCVLRSAKIGKSEYT